MPKFVEIYDLFKNGRPYVLDRSLSEDIYVYAEYWSAGGLIDERSAATYATLAKHFFELIPPPDILIVCEAELETCLSRINSRGRSDAYHHSESYLNEISRHFRNWIDNYTDSPIIFIDSETLDFSDPKILIKVTEDIQKLVEYYQFVESAQLTLFPDRKSGPTTLHYPDRIKYSIPTGLSIKSRHQYSSISSSYKLNQHPTAYIAAPFTKVATRDAKSSQETQAGLFRTEPRHGQIPEGPYRSSLLAIEKALKLWGLSTLLPHRDVNHWGVKTLTPQQAMTLCTLHVEQSSIFVGLLSESAGAHYEYGLAHGLGLPCIIIKCSELGGSFLSIGIESSHADDLIVVNASTLRDIPGLLARAEVGNFLSRYIAI